MALYTNIAGETVDAVQLSEEEAAAQGAVAGSWRVSGTGDSHSTALIGDESFRLAHTPFGPGILQPPAKFANEAGDIVEAVAIPAPGHWQVTAADGTTSTLSDEEFQASHTPLVEATSTKYTNAAGEVVDAAQLSDALADAQGVEHGSWRVIAADGAESTLSDEAFQASHTPVPVAAVADEAPVAEDAEVVPVVEEEAVPAAQAPAEVDFSSTQSEQEEE